MIPRGMRAVLIALAFIASGAPDIHAQVTVMPLQNLQFGELIPGVATTVAPTDVARRAALVIEGRGQLRLTFQLPTALVAPGGLQIPLVFNAQSGRIDIRHKITTFHPGSGVSIHINPADLDRAEVYLGAQALPAPAQPPGSYTATIVMMVLQTGS